MRRISSAEVRKKNRPLLFCAALFFVFGLGLLLIPQAYTPVPYDTLQETTVAVSSVRDVFDIHGLSLQIITSDGKRYTLVGTYKRSEVRQAIAACSDVKIRYYQDVFSKLFRTRYAAEVHAGGETVVSFGGWKFVRFPWLRLLAFLIILGGVGLIAYGRWEIRWREKQEQMRNRRIEKNSALSKVRVRRRWEKGGGGSPVYYIKKL